MGRIFWFCCNCGDGPFGTETHDQCIGCQHIQCLYCECVKPKLAYIESRQAEVKSLVRRDKTVENAASRSAPSQGGRSSTLVPLVSDLEGLSLSTKPRTIAPALLRMGVSSELSECTKERLAHLDRLKASYKSKLDEAVNEYSIRNSNLSPHEKEVSALEQYLQDLARPTEFAFVWELSTLPFLVEVLPEWLGRGFAINVLRNSINSSSRTICFTSQVKPSRIRRLIIARHILDIIPVNFHNTISFQFCHGTVQRIGSQKRGKDIENPDAVCDAKNPYFYFDPMMGDSIGPSSGSCTATLGPCIKSGDRRYWLACLHVFIKSLRKKGWDAKRCRVLHPGCMDKKICGHTPLRHSPRQMKLGLLCARSGDNLKTTRKSCHPYWPAFQVDPPEVVTDWVLISTAASEPNALRLPKASADKQCPHVTMSLVLPEAKIHSTGRTSGYQYGHVCQIPAYLDADQGHGAARSTREWYVEQPQDSEYSEDYWLESGPGLPGDSGAPVVDSENNTLYGQLWGRNKYWGPGPRIIYFTAMQDIDIDIQEKARLGPLELPQSKSQDTGVLSHLVCVYCSNAQSDSSMLEPEDEDEEKVSIMSLSNDDQGAASWSSEASASGNGRSLYGEEQEWIHSESNDIMSLDSDNLEAMGSACASSAEQVDSPEGNDNNIGVGLDEAAIMDLMTDPFQCFDETTYYLDFNDENISMDEDEEEEEENDIDFPMRSCTSKKGKTASTSCLKKIPTSSSWVMIQVKPKPVVNGTTEVRNRISQS